MKKLSLLFFTFCVSVMSWAADALLQANPFAYDLRSEVIENGTKLKLTYSLNATAVTSDTYNEDHHGLQIYLIDENGNRIKKEDGTTWVCTSGSYQKGKDHSVIIPIADLPPAAKETNLSWEVVVHGNKNRTKPKMVDDYYPVAANTPKDNYKPRAGHGIAVDKDPQSKWFGRIFVAEACTTTTGKNSLLEYDMLLNYRTFHHKDVLDGESSYFSSALNNEPHRVKFSEDGRIFATCYHPTAISAVLEYVGNGEWKTVVEANQKVNQYQDEVIFAFDNKYNRRPIAMDVKGEGENLKILVAWMKPKGKKINDNLFAQIQCIEYNVGKNKYKLDQDNDGTIIAEYLDHAINESGTSPHGMLFNSYRLDYNQAKHGFVDVAYGDNGSIWLKVDFGFGVSEGRRSHIIRFDEGSIEPQYTYTFPSTSMYRSDGGYYGGSGLFVKGNQLITGSGASTILAYKIKADKTLDATDSNILSISTGSPGTKTWTNAIAEDYAGNLYCVSDTADNIIVVAMPYDGTRITRAPASQTFTLSDPIPNILANDLRCTPHATQNKYIFSFNVNTKPEVAQLRFYDSYEDMKKSLNEKNADKYQGTNNNKPAFVYNIPEDKLKQGRIEVVLGGVAGQVTDGVITNDRLPAGVLYWSVYVKTRTSHSFAPVYTQPLTGKHAHNRLHATVNNYPETDNFGYIYAPDYATDNVCKLMVYSIGDGNVDDEDRTQITSTTRYDLVQNLDISQVVNTRRPAVAPDGSVFLADFGASTDKITTQGPAGFDQGGVWVFNPNLLQNKSTSGSASVTRFHSANETSSGVCFYGTGNSLKLYKTNTYDEIARFPNSYNESARLTNGYRIFNVGNSDGTIKYTMNLTDGTEVAIKTQSTGYGTTLKDVGGDANGNISIKVVSDGVWLCQHRSGTAHVNPTAKNPNPDSFEATALMFQNNNGKRAFSSFEATVNGASLSQTGTSIMQSTPGAGMAISPDEKYLYVVNHEGNILEFQIGGTSNAKTLTHTRTFVNTTQYKTISTLNFDYVGNLVASTDKSYPDMETQIVVFTMPREQRTNACEIQAPNSCRMIPERVAQLDMDEEYLAEVIAEHQYDHPDGCAVDLYRPLQGKMFNTICLPFDLNLDELPNDHPLKNAVAKKFTGLSIDDIAGEKILSLVFTDLNNNEDKNTLIANVPYIIQPRDEGIRSIVRFDGPIKLTGVHVYDQEREITYSGTDYNVTFHGIVPYQDVAPNIVDGVYLTLMLVADNRLAAMTSSGQMLGFRGYFDLNKALPQGIKARISTDKKTPTNTTIIVDGQKVNVEKFLREGRVYIRVGEALYTITGEKVE